MKRKLASLLVEVILCGSLLVTGCSGQSQGSVGDQDGSQAAVNEDGIPQADPDKRYDISYTGYWCFSSYEDGSYVEKMIEDALNVDITVEKAETSDTIDLLLASGEMPDCMWIDKPVDWMQEQELIRTIPRDMVEYYCPNLIAYYDEFPLMYEKTLVADDDSQFRYLTGVTFQFVDYYLPGDFYRYDWIENLGIDLGVNVEQVADNLYVADDGIELSKFAEIMDAFVNKDPDGNGKKDTVGVTGEKLDLGQFFSAYGFHQGINEADGRAEQYYAIDAYKDYLKGFADLYKRGLIDPEIITGDRTLSWDKVNSGVAGYWITSTSALNTWAVDRPPLTLMERNPEAKILVTPGIKPDGGTVQATVNESPSYGSFYVNANVDDEKLAKILQFLNFTLFGNGDKDIHASLIYGEKGVDWEWNEDETVPVQLHTLKSGERGTWSFGQFGQDRELTRWTGEEELFMTGAKYWAAGADGIWMKWQKPQYKMDLAGVTDFGRKESEISGDVDAYVSNYRTQAVLGQINVDDTWEDYLAELDRMGYNDMMDELEKVKPLEEIAAGYAK